MQQILDFVRNHPIYIIDAIVLVYVVMLFRKKAREERQTRIDLLHDSLAADTQAVSVKNNVESVDSADRS